MSTDAVLLRRLDRIFEARSVALIGVSANAHKLNGAPLRILQVSGFNGAIWPVNPKYTEIEGLTCYPDIASLPGVPDVALVLAPAREVPGVLQSCADLGCRAAVVVSSGFEEFEGGGALVEQMRAVCEREGIALVGPNCEGIWSVRHRVMLTFGSAAKRTQFTHSPVAILSQSGAMGGAIARHLQDNGYGCAYLVSVGNETALGLLDYLEYMIERDDVRLVLMFTEGLRDGQRLGALAERARARGIVLVALKSGNSDMGRLAVASHTGKVATDSSIYRDVFNQAGVISVDGLVELIEAAELFVSSPLPRRGSGPKPGISVYSIPGGTRALTADLCESHGLTLTEFSEATVNALQAQLPAFGQAHNPTDMTGQLLSQPEMFHSTLLSVANDPGTEALLIQLANRGPADASKYHETIRTASRGAGVPALISFLGDALPGADRQAFARDGLICARDPGDAVRWLDWLYQARSIFDAPAFDGEPWQARVRQAECPSSGDASDHATQMAWLGAAGISVPQWRLLEAGVCASKACDGLLFPVAVKALARDADHKTERRLLELGLRSTDEVDAAAQAIRSRLGHPNATLLVQQMVSGGVEMVVSAMRNPDFGLVLAIGSGGVMIELLEDIRYLATPCDPRQIRRAIDQLRGKRILEGFRGAPATDIDALVSAALGVAALAQAQGLAEIEINPLIVLPQGQGAMAVDCIMRRSR